jgi:hypothetical protein
MQQKSVCSNCACPCCLGYKPKLQAALHRIWHNLRWEAVRLERLLQAFAYIRGMIVRGAALPAVFCGVPRPFLFRYHMVPEHDGRMGNRHEALKEFCLAIAKGLDGNRPDVAAYERLNDGFHDVFGIEHHLFSVEVISRKKYLL